MAVPATRRYSYAEYLDLERETGVRHELLDGAVVAMAGGTLRHSRIKTNLAVCLGSALWSGPCEPYGSDAKIRVPASGLATYPDLAVISGPPERHPNDHHAATNPTALFEVLSRSTERWDRDGKFEHLRALESLRLYVLIKPDRPRVDVFERLDGGEWRFRAYGAGELIELGPIGAQLAVDDLYGNLPDGEEDDDTSSEPPSREA